MRVKSSLGVKLLVGILVLEIVFSASVSVIVAIMLRRSIMEKYADTGLSVTSSLAQAIDGDKVLTYLSNPRVDDYYLEIQEGITRYRREFGVSYIYIAVPKEEGLFYIWDAGELDVWTIGLKGDFSPGGYEWSIARMNGTQEHSLHEFDDPQYGNLASAAYPIYNSKGQAVALVYADFSLESIADAIRQTLMMIIISIVAITAVTIILSYFYIKGNLVVPLKKLTGATSKLTDNLDTDEVYPYGRRDRRALSFIREDGQGAS